MRLMKPFDVLKEGVVSSCLWLNSPQSHRPLWDRLWNAAEQRVCTDGGANVLMQRSASLRPPSLVSGDFDSIGSDARVFFSERGVELRETPDQNHTDMTKALRIIVHDEKTGPIVVLGGLSGRFDHSLASINSLLLVGAETDRDIFLFDGENIMFILKQGSTELVISKSDVTGVCGIVPFCQQKTVVTTEGFKWDVEEAEMAFGGLVSTSNQVEGETVRVDTTAPLIFTMQLEKNTVM